MAREQDRKQFRRVGLRAPRHHDSDHQAVVAIFYGGRPGKVHQYRKRRQRVPLRLPRQGPHGEAETAFEELREAVEPTPPRKCPANQWISEGTWAIINHRAMLRRQGGLDQRGGQRLGRRIQSSLKAGRRQRAANCAADIAQHLKGGNLKEAWRCVQGWYRQAKALAP
jgi:hypothetical protein